MFKLKPMASINKEVLDKVYRDKDGRFSPFTLDAFSMGRRISSDVYMMFDSHNSEPFNNCYFINTITGERQRLVSTHTSEFKLNKVKETTAYCVWPNGVYVDYTNADSFYPIYYDLGDDYKVVQIPTDIEEGSTEFEKYINS